MTMVFKKARPDHRTRSAAEETLLVTSANTNEILVLENDPATHKVELPPDFLTEVLLN
jgi:hypothetical protein